MGPHARHADFRSVALRLVLPILLLLGQPGGICFALCALTRHPVPAPVPEHHHGSHTPAAPCHGAAASQAFHGQLDALVLAFTPAASTSVARAVPDGPASHSAGIPRLTRHPVPDPPPPRA
jgi:hypothetical protein